MFNSHKGTKDFLLGALIGGIVGVAAVSASRSKGKKKGSSKIHEAVHHIDKIIKASKNEENLAELIDWATEGVQLWNKLKKGK
jgi:gas vesicle protein